MECRTGLPDHCIFGAKASLVSSSKQGKQKANTKENKEHFEGLAPKMQ